MDCPCCGQKIPDAPLVLDLATNVLTDGKVKVRLRPSVAVIAYRLIKTMPLSVHPDGLISALGAKFDRESRNPQKCIQVYVSQLRHVLRTMGYLVVPNYSVGYRIIPDRDEGIIEQDDIIRQAKKPRSVSKPRLVSG